MPNHATFVSNPCHVMIWHCDWRLLYMTALIQDLFTSVFLSIYLATPDICLKRATSRHSLMITRGLGCRLAILFPCFILATAFELKFNFYLQYSYVTLVYMLFFEKCNYTFSLLSSFHTLEVETVLLRLRWLLLHLMKSDMRSALGSSSSQKWMLRFSSESLNSCIDYNI